MNPFRSLANRFGYELINRKKWHHFDVNTHLAYLLEKFDINLVLDVGANVGQFGTGLRIIGYKGRIVSFEPVTSAFERLSALAYSDGNWQAFQVALGADVGVGRIHVTSASNLSSFFPPDANAREHFQDQAQVIGVQSVEVNRLDNLLSSLAEGVVAPRIFLKMDTQGYDIQVMKGAARCLDNILGLQSELSVIPLYEGMPDYLEALSHYKTCGYEVTGMYPIGRDRKNLVVMEFDCFLVRTA